MRDKVSPSEAREMRLYAASLGANWQIGNVCQKWPDVERFVVYEVLRGERQRSAGGPIVKRKRASTPSLYPMSKAEWLEFKKLREKIARSDGEESEVDRHADSVRYAVLLRLLAESTAKFAKTKEVEDES